MMPNYSDLGSASGWLCCVGNLLQSIKSTTQIWVETCHPYVISVFTSRTSFRWGTNGGVTKYWLFFHAGLMFVIHKCKAQLPTTQSAF